MINHIVYFRRVMQDETELQEMSKQRTDIRIVNTSPAIVELEAMTPTLMRSESGEIKVVCPVSLEIVRLNQYPVECPPMVRVNAPTNWSMFHPNIEPRSGLICLGLEKAWAPSISITNVVNLALQTCSLERFNLTSVFKDSSDAAEYVSQLAIAGRLPLKIEA